MTIYFMRKTLSLRWPTHLAGTIGAALWTTFAIQLLDANYVQSLHPTDVFTGQTGFSGALVKGYYSHMADLGTLGVYIQTQFIDFGFIIGVFLTSLMLATLLMRGATAGSWGYKIAMFSGLAGMFGAGMDVCENLISFVMLANPADFPNWIALPYSTAAVLKFSGMTIGMGLGLLALLLIVLGRLSVFVGSLQEGGENG